MAKRIGALHAQTLTAVARRRDLIYLAVTHAALVRQDIAHSFFIANYRGAWSECGRENWKCVGMTVVHHPDERMLAISEDGDAFTYAAGASTTESIKPRPIVLRGVRAIEGKAVAYGMRRQVYLRQGEGRWHPMHAPDIQEGQTAGFEALCGFSLSDLYAVGWEGEVWHYDGRAWRREDSPVNIILTAATTHDDGNVYACGQNGTLIRGTVGRWEVAAKGDTIDDFWTIASFNGDIYVASFGALYKLVGGHLEIVDIEGVPCDTFQVLSAADGVLWSFGSNDVIASDGQHWTKVW